MTKYFVTKMSCHFCATSEQSFIIIIESIFSFQIILGILEINIDYIKYICFIYETFRKL